MIDSLLQKTDRYSFSLMERELIVTASALHDIGKIGIDECILNKPGKLTKEEFDIFKTHTMTGADILAEDKLFATLDPTTRSLKLPSGQEILLTDTVGFIRKLPHHLIDAFKSTLEEAKYADMILHVVDVSNPQADEQMFTVYETLQGLKVQDKPIITVFNKQDRLEGIPVIRDFKADYTVSISAKTKAGLGDLLETIEALLRQQKVYIEEVYPYSEAGKIQLIRKYGELLEENYTEEGIQVTAYVPADIYPQIVVNR